MNLIDYPIDEAEEEAFIHRALGIKNFDTTKVLNNLLKIPYRTNLMLTQIYPEFSKVLKLKENIDNI